MAYSIHELLQFLHESKCIEELQNNSASFSMYDSPPSWAVLKCTSELNLKNYLFGSNVTVGGDEDSPIVSLFQLISGNLTPSTNLVSMGVFELDTNGDFQPAAGSNTDTYFEFDTNLDIQPI